MTNKDKYQHADMLLDCLMHHGQERTIDKSQASALRLLRRDDTSEPVIFVGAGTCGLGAGAGKTMDAIHAWIREKGVSARVMQVGCIGLCAAEPIVDLQLPGRTRISFQKVNADCVPELFDEVFAGSVPAPRAIGQFRKEGLEAWPGIPYIDEHPFFAPRRGWC